MHACFYFILFLISHFPAIFCDLLLIKLLANGVITMVEAFFLFNGVLRWFCY